MFDWSIISDVDIVTARRYIGEGREPDLIIRGEKGEAYLYRWHVIERASGGPQSSVQGNVYFHIQVLSDPERPLHTHPWRGNMSVILAGDGYDELVQKEPPYGRVELIPRRTGDVIFRGQREAHRLLLPVNGKYGYTMTQFTTGPYVGDWGFWLGDKFYPHNDIVVDDGKGNSVFTYPPGYKKET